MDSTVDIVRGMLQLRFLQSLNIHQIQLRRDHLEETLQLGIVQPKLLDTQYPKHHVLAQSLCIANYVQLLVTYESLNNILTTEIVQRC